MRNRTPTLLDRLRTLACLFAALVAVPFLKAEKLPLKVYTVADGLGMDQINVIRQDSRNLLWFGTSDGVSWFDGYQFVRYTTDDGLPGKVVSDVLETRSGEIWLGTGAGACLFRWEAERGDERGGSRFVTVVPKKPLPDRVDAGRLVEGPDGSIWCASSYGLCRITRAAGFLNMQLVDIGMRNTQWGDTIVRDLTFDKFGTLWVAANSGLYGRRPDGRVIRPAGAPPDEIHALEACPDGTLWAGAKTGLLRVAIGDNGETASLTGHFTIRDGMPSNRIWSLELAHDGRLWVGTFEGLALLEDWGSRRPRIRTYTTANGLTDVEITALAEDGERNIWIGTDHGGALKVSRQGFETFDASDGLEAVRAVLAMQDRAGHVVFLMNVENKFFASFDGKRFSSVRLPGTEGRGWVGAQAVLQDPEGGWWVATGLTGLQRYSACDAFVDLAGRRPVKIYTKRDGLPDNFVFGVFQDSLNDIWVMMQGGLRKVARLDHRTGRFSVFPIEYMPSAMIEDGAGSIWLATLGPGMYRFRSGRFEPFQAEQGFPTGSVYHLYKDRRGLIWVSSLSNGVFCITDPDADPPKFMNITTRQGLSSNHTRFVVESADGAYYIGTARGLDRWDPRTGLIRQFTTSDGLAGNLQNIGLRDRSDNLWLGTFLGVSRLTPQIRRKARPADAYIRGLSLGGIPWPLDALGQFDVPDVVVPMSRNRVAIDFAGVSFAPGEVLSYRYRLAGVDSDWRPLSTQRRLDLVDLEPGTYRVELQAINSDGIPSPRAATVNLTILAPIWRRWWFVAGVLLLAGAAIFVVVRMRVQRHLDMERVRTRIATDLHDDIGSSLSQLSIMCEVALRKIPDDPSAAAQSLGQVTETSRSLIDSMSDIVWAINPARDGLTDLVHRMRHFANDLFAEGAIRYRFDCSSAERNLPLGNDVRRQIYLVYKECLNNLVKHSRATQALIELRLRDGCLELSVNDNGVGFDPAIVTDRGNGLRNLRKRAETLGGRLTIDSQIGQGTHILFKIAQTAASQRCRWL